MPFRESIKKKWKLVSSFILAFIFFPIVGVFILLYDFLKKVCKKVCKWARKPGSMNKHRG